MEKPIVYNLRFSEAFFKHNLKQWPFEGPIVIKESADMQETSVFDQWCFLGDVQGMKKEYFFDYDIYKILLRYLSDKTNMRNVKQIKSKQSEKEYFSLSQSA